MLWMKTLNQHRNGNWPNNHVLKQTRAEVKARSDLVQEGAHFKTIKGKRTDPRDFITESGVFHTWKPDATKEGWSPKGIFTVQ